MFQIAFATIGSVIIVSLVSFIGVFTLFWKEEEMKPVLFILVSFAAGALLGDVFFHLLPESVEETGLSISVSFSILAGILIFFILEKFIHWRHCHMPHEHHPLPREHSSVRPFAILNLFGDGVHNFIDGMLIAASYLVSLPLGLATTIAVALHEIPQEIGDLAILVHGGVKKKRALLLNFLSATTAILGAVFVLILGKDNGGITHILIPFTIGGFLYIAGADLIPELHKETKPGNSVLQFLGFIAGMFMMYLLLFLEV